MKSKRNTVFTLSVLALLVISLLLVNLKLPTIAQSDDLIYLHGPTLTPIHMHGPRLTPVHMHSTIGAMGFDWDPYDPWYTPWHELYPEYCETWTFTSWEDNGNGYLDPSDQIDLTNDITEEVRWYHVDRVTVTLLLMHEVSGELIYVEYKDETWNPRLDPLKPNITKPVCTYWHEVWPVYHGVFGPGNPYHIIGWIDNGNGYLDFCDWIEFEDWPMEYWHVEEYATDLILNEKVMDPIDIEWHELYPNYCNYHWTTSWEEPIEDPFPGRLSPGDQIDMLNLQTVETKWYYVDRVTFTMIVTNETNPDDWMYIEYKGPFETMYDVKTNVTYSTWHEVYPFYSESFWISEWIDNCNGVLDYCDTIELWVLGADIYLGWWHVEELAIDIILNEKVDDPTGIIWHELYPDCCINDYETLDWQDNGDGLLNPCDNVTLALLPTGLMEEYHVENMTLTLNLTVLDIAGFPPFTPGDRIYIEYLAALYYGWEWMYYPKTHPNYTDWEVVCPTEWFGYPLTIENWYDDCNGVLSYCDMLELSSPEGELWCHVDEVAVDITVKKITVEPVHDVAVTNVSPYFTSVYQGWPCPIQVTVENQGDFTETFDVDVKYDGTHVTTSPITVNNLPPHTGRVLTFCWVTTNVPLGPYTISAYAHPVSGETDLADNSLVDGTVTIQASFPAGFYWKEGFCDYAPSGMPDFDERQDLWNTTGTWTYCSPTAVANSLWWLDSEFEPTLPPLLPPTISDGFPLLTSYNHGVWDDHAPQNVQPFIQHLAYLMDTDGQRTFQKHQGTYVNDMQAGITHYLSWSGVNPLGDCNGDGIVDNLDVWIVGNATGSMPGTPGWDIRADVWPVTTGWPAWGPADNIIDLSDVLLVANNFGKRGMFYEHTVNQPHFYYVEEEVEKSQDVVLSLGFWYWNGEFWQTREELGHSVTVAGVNSEELKIGISDPIWDAFENHIIPQGRVPIPHTHTPPEPPYITHNDAALVSHDIYDVINITLTPGSPGRWILHLYPGVPPDPVPWPTPGWYAVVEDAVITSPSVVHDVAVINVTSAKTVICQGCLGNITVTVENQGDLAENFNVTAYADTTVIGEQTVALPPHSSTSIVFTWNATGFSKGNYTIKAVADTVAGETDTADNTYVDGWVIISMIGDITGGDGWPDGECNMLDVATVARYFGQTSPPAPANYDVIYDGAIDMVDVATVAKHFGETDP